METEISINDDEAKSDVSNIAKRTVLFNDVIFNSFASNNETENKIESMSSVPFSSSRALVPVEPKFSGDKGITHISSILHNLQAPNSITFVSESHMGKPLTLHESSLILDCYHAYGQRKLERNCTRRKMIHRSSLPYRHKLLNHFKDDFLEFKIKAQERRMSLAASTNNIETVEQLLNAGISPNNQDLRGGSPLHFAACRGYAEIVRLLLQHGANPNLQDCLGNTPLHLATLTNKVPVVTLLLEAGTNVNTCTNHGFTPLYLAQTRLRLLQSSKCEDVTEIEKQMFEIVNMLRVYLKKIPAATESCKSVEWQRIDDYYSKLSPSAHNSAEKVQNDVRSLLSSIEALNLS